MSEPTSEYLTVKEISERLKLDRHVVVRWFESEPGVIDVGRLETIGRGVRGGVARRRYRELRIPRGVFQRVLQRRTIQ